MSPTHLVGQKHGNTSSCEPGRRGFSAHHEGKGKEVS